MDFELGHTYPSAHQFKPQNLTTMETHKRSEYHDAYHVQGIAFAPLLCNSLGQLGPDFLRFLWFLANHAARNQVPLELIALPQLGLDEPSPSQVAFQRLRCAIYTHFTRFRLCMHTSALLFQTKKSTK